MKNIGLDLKYRYLNEWSLCQNKRNTKKICPKRHITDILCASVVIKILITWTCAKCKVTDRYVHNVYIIIIIIIILLIFLIQTIIYTVCVLCRNGIFGRIWSDDDDDNSEPLSDSIKMWWVMEVLWMMMMMSKPEETWKKIVACSSTIIYDNNNGSCVSLKM